MPNSIRSGSLFVALSSVIFSICVLVVIFYSLSFDTGIYPTVVLGQESNQTRINESDTFQNNNDINQSSPFSAYDTDKAIKNSNNAINKENTPNRLITLVTEDTFVDIAPGERVKAWTFNGTVPGPTIRLAEGENVTIKYINKSPIPHTIHFHGNHDDVNDGVIPQVMPGQTYLYNITGEPAGALMYHCHAPPTSLHIRMGMYGALIVDPIGKQQIAPAKEFVMVMGEYSLKNQMGFEADYYIINGYADQYVHNPLQINQQDLMRIYLINLGTTLPASFHLHSTTFLTYPSGLWSNLPIHSQTVSVAPGDASIVEAKWKYPGNYFFHTHGIQEEKGNMGQIKVIGQADPSEGLNSRVGNTTSSTPANPNLQQQQSNNIFEPLTKSVSMFDWQYELQKRLQNPIVASQSDNKGIDQEEKKVTKEMNETKSIQKQGENLSLSLDKTLATNITESSAANSNSNQISIVSGSSSPDSKIFYDPPNAEVQVGTEVTWINNDTNMPHTVTSGDSGTSPTGVFDSGIMMGDGSQFKHTFDQKGEFEYYCTLHPWMIAKIIVK
jgi:FtsP/CotA-like multicopper oxidase with cupredoxin domain